LDEIIIFLKILLHDGSSLNVISQKLPTDRKSECVEPIVVDEMLHLAKPVCSVVLGERRPCCGSGTGSVGVAAEVETRDVNAGELELACSGCGWEGEEWFYVV
jgi:hypothetical protein